LYASNSDKKVHWLIKCECGVEIALIPDLTEMGHAIQAHALAHAAQIKNPDKAEAESNRIEDLLIEQLLKIIYTKMKDKKPLEQLEMA